MMFRQLEYFVALARERHFARAAEACFVSQPALSESIRRLESELGVPLVRRGHSFQELTPEGESVLKWARRLIQDRESLCREAASLQDGLTGTLRLGVVPAASSTTVGISDPFARTHPGVTIRLQTSLQSTQIVQRVRNYELDAGLIYAAPEDLEGLLVIELYAEKHVLLTAGALRSKAANPMSWEQALQLPLCLLDDSMRGRQVLDSTLRRNGLEVEPRIECDSIVALIAHVATGHWASIVPKEWLAPLGRLEGLTMTELASPAVSSRISLIMDAAQPMPVLSRALLRTIRESFPAVEIDIDLS